MYGMGQNGQNFGMPSWMQELLWKMQADQQASFQQKGMTTPSQIPTIFPEGHPYRRFMKNPLAGLEEDPMAGKENPGIVLEGHPYRKFMKNPNQGTMSGTEQTPPSKLLPEGHPYRKFMKDPTAGLPIQEMDPLSGLQPPQKIDRAQEMKNIKAITGLNEEEKNRALGMMLVKLFGGLAQPGHGDGLNGALSALAQNMGGAVDVYAGEEGRVQDLNTRLFGHIDNKEIEQQKAWQHMLEKLQDQLHKKDMLDENIRHHQEAEINNKNNAEANQLYREMMLANTKENRQNNAEQKEVAKLTRHLESKETKGLDLAWQSMQNAAQLFNNPQQDPTRSKAWVWGKPDFVKNDQEKDLEQYIKDIQTGAGQALQYNETQKRSLPIVDINDRDNSVNALIATFDRLKPHREQQLKYQAQKEALETGENEEQLFRKKKKQLLQEEFTFLSSLKKTNVQNKEQKKK